MELNDLSSPGISVSLLEYLRLRFDDLDLKEWFQEKRTRLHKDGSCAYNASPKINCCNETLELRQQPYLVAPIGAKSPYRVSGCPVGLTPPSHDHFVPNQIVSSSQGGPQNVCTKPQCMELQAHYLQQQRLMQHLQSENKELRRQLILSQQPNQIVLERNFADVLIPPESQMLT